MQTQTDKLSATFSALADPTRRAILTRLSTGEASVQDLAKPFRMSLPAVSKHLKVLERASLIRRSRTAQWRPCYLEAAPLKEAAEWVDQYRKFWEETFDRLDAYLQELQAEATTPTKEGKPKKSKKKEKKKHGKRK
jgi:DNA-binding transcriptional ArsR family regulator